ncbi:hypothetical protein KP509_35G050100 [Ceratopteris richardii]|nr:hypothetical protein KP509_35G050100 [Ceratopteris richardii]
MGRTPADIRSHVKVTGSNTWECKYCKGIFTGSASRIKAHLLGLRGGGIGKCHSVPQQITEDLTAKLQLSQGVGSMQVSEDCLETLEMLPNAGESSSAPSKRARTDSVSSSGASANVATPSSRAQPPSNSGPIPRNLPESNVFMRSSMKASMQKQAMDQAKKEIGRLFILCGIPFNVANTTAWKRAMRAVSRIGTPWEGPSGRVLRTSELTKQKLAVETEMLSLRATWEKYGCSILCDGWSDMRKRSVYNIMVSSCKGTMFLRAIPAHAPGTVVTGEFIFSHVKKAIEDVGSRNVIQVVTDNGSNCVAMGRMLEEEYPKITWTPCASHSLDLLMEDIGSLPWVENILSKAKFIVKFVTSRPKVQNIFRSHSDLELQKPAFTRFCYIFIVLDRVLRVRKGLLRTVVAEEWYQIPEARDGDPLFMRFSSLVMGEDAFWSKAEVLIAALQPVYSVLRITDMEGSTLGLVYEYVSRIQGCIADVSGLSDTE